MTPPIQKDWWLAAALTGAALPQALAQPATPAGGREQAGVVTTVTQGVGTSAPIYIDNATNRRLSTGPNQTLHVLFSDRSALTLGPNTEVTISDYKYDARAQDGNIAVSMATGLLRVVGGLLSKKRETRITTSSATIGVRGGITVAESNGQNTSATFLFGQSMRANNNNGETVITRPGFGTNINGNNPPGPPQRTDANTLASLLNRLETRPAGGGTPPPPGGGNLAGRGNPGTLAPDRLKPNVDNTPANTNPNQTLRNLLGSGQAPGTQQDLKKTFS